MGVAKITTMDTTMEMTHQHIERDPVDSAFRTLMRGLVVTGLALAVINVAIVCLRANVL